jgi:hypothetical protein
MAQSGEKIEAFIFWTITAPLSQNETVHIVSADAKKPGQSRA